MIIFRGPLAVASRKSKGDTEDNSSVIAAKICCRDGVKRIAPRDLVEKSGLAH